MAGAPKVGKTLLAQEISRRLQNKIWVVDTGDGWWSQAWRERTAEMMLEDHFQNGGVDVLLVIRTNRADQPQWPELDAERDKWVIYKANLIFIVESVALSINPLEKGWPKRCIWNCRHFLDRHGEYKHNWAWDSRMPDPEWWAQHVKLVSPSMAMGWA